MTTPRIEDARDELRTWAKGMTDALEDMLRDLRAGRYEDTTPVRDFDVLRGQMARFDTLLDNLKAQQGRHRGPGCPGHVTLRDPATHRTERGTSPCGSQISGRPTD